MNPYSIELQTPDGMRFRLTGAATQDAWGFDFQRGHAALWLTDAYPKEVAKVKAFLEPLVGPARGQWFFERRKPRRKKHVVLPNTRPLRLRGAKAYAAIRRFAEAAALLDGSESADALARFDNSFLDPDDR